MHHTKEKGDLGVLKAQVDLYEQGFVRLNPMTEHAAFDLVAYRQGEFVRVQVKYKSVDKFGGMTVHFRSSWTDKNGTHTRQVNKDDVDLYCIYCPDTDDCYYLNPKEFNRSVILRVEASRNNQSKNIKLAADYRRVP